MPDLRESIVMVFGMALAITGVFLFAKSKGAFGKNRIKFLGAEFELSTPSLVIFVMGCLLLALPYLGSKPAVTGSDSIATSPQSVRDPNPSGEPATTGEVFTAKSPQPLPAPKKPDVASIVNKTWRAKLRLFDQRAGGRHFPIFPGYTPILVFDDSPEGHSVSVTFDFESMVAGDSAEVRITELVDSANTPVRTGARFTVYDGNPSGDHWKVGEGIILGD